jgi:transposase, IS30 family
LRFAVCMQTVNLKTKLRLHLTGRRRRSVGSCGATRNLPRSGRVATSLSVPSNWPSAGANGMAASSWRASRTLRNSVGKSLAMGHSPEQIAGRLARQHGRVIISHESIYRFIYHRAAQKDSWYRLLPRHKRARGRQRRISASFIKWRSITERPAEAQGREAAGHWEADFMLFARCGQGLLVLHKRQTRFSMVRQPVDRKAVRTARTIARQLDKLPKAMRKTISFDNGNEFAEHHRLHKVLGVQTFFCDPHRPWQKGGVENSIGRLRRSLPRKTDLNLITAATLQQHVQRLNDTPRKCLDFQTPAEAFSKLKSTVAP